MWRFKNPSTALSIRGLGVVTSNNLTDDIAVRILGRNSSYSKYLINDDKVKVKDGGSPKSGGGSKGGGKSKGDTVAKEEG